MSVHGECFDIAQMGRCNVEECYLFVNGDCEIADEMIEYFVEDLENVGDKEKFLENFYGKVQLWTMRGADTTLSDEQLITEALGYSYER